MRTLAESRNQVLHALVLFLALWAAIAPAHARQILEGPLMIKAYRIEFNNRAIGKVVVVGRDNPNPPPGYSAGQQYWTWTPEEAWRGTFTLVPVSIVPDFYSHSWATFPNGRFDLSRTVSMAPISAEAGDRFYRVQVRSGSGWLDQGWMWLINGAEQMQAWYGRNLTSDQLGDGAAIRFTSAEPPAPGSTRVYLLID